MADQREPDGLTPEELEAESAEALPERAAMSTLSPAGLDPTGGAVEAVGDAVGGTASDTPEGTVGSVGEAVEDTGPVVSDTAGTVGETVGQVDVPGTVGGVGDTVGDTVGGVDVPGTVGGVGGTVDGVTDNLTNASLLDLDVNVDGDLDAAAPINAGVAANANAALPIDAAVSANTLSPDAQSLASANQDSLLSQNIEADAIANSNQDSTIGQGEQAPDPAPAPDPADQSHSLLDLDANIDLGLDLAAPIDAAVAANANIAAPIDAAVSANTLSPDSTSVASAAQHSTIVQNIEGSAEANADQTSVIEQGEDGS